MNRRWAVSVFVTACIAAALPLFAFGWHAVAETEREAERRMLELAQLAATQADHILMEAFFEVELMASRALADGTVSGGCFAGDPPGAVDGEPANFSSVLFVLDCEGEVVFTELTGEYVRLDQEAAGGLFALAASATDRYISPSFTSPTSGHPMVGLSLPLFGEGGVRLGTISGLIDLEQHFSADLFEVVEGIGRSAHADLIAEQGAVIASTSHAQSGARGAHPGFYEEMAGAGGSSVRRVPYVASLGEAGGSHLHVMAYSSLGGAPWGVAIGASEAETLEAGQRLRRTLIRLGAAAAAALLVGAALVALTVPRGAVG